MGDRPRAKPDLGAREQVYPIDRAQSEPTLGPRTVEKIYLIAEEVGEVPDEAYAKLVRELARALTSHSAVITHMTPPQDYSRNHVMRLAHRGIRRMAALVDPRLWAAVRRARPQTVVYVSRSSATLAALVRSRLLRAISGRRVVMVALQPRTLGRVGRLFARVLWPDLLLVSTHAEVDNARALGARAQLMITGVDLERFRPPAPREKDELRRKWGLPLDGKILLHVGHLTGGRNLDALLSLARRPGWSVVFVASSQHDVDSSALEGRLRDGGLIVLKGFFPDVGEIYRAADCYVFPTASSDHAIALPLSVLEALASNIPVAATRFGALAERFGGQPGLALVDDPNELALAVEQLLAAPHQTRHLAEAFSWQAVAEHIHAAAG